MPALAKYVKLGIFLNAHIKLCATGNRNRHKMIKFDEVTFSWSDSLLFDKVSFQVSSGQKVGLVGPNGSGKTSLFALIGGHETPKDGRVEVTGTIGYVPQEVKRDPEMEGSTSVRDYLIKDEKLADFELRRMLSGLELGNLDLSVSPKGLSGGQKTKLALARALLTKPDILLLDEPTNFMDIAGKLWVTGFLSKYEKTLIIISHDLKLLDHAIDKVLAINSQTKKIEEYKGNYTKAMKLKSEAEALLTRTVIAETKHIKKMEESVIRLQRFTSEKGVRQRVMLERRIERLKEDLPELPKEVKRINLKLPDPAPVGELPIRAIGIGKSFGEKRVLSDVNFSIKRRERIALIGPNGSGKSTFLKILMGKLEQDMGEVIRSQNLKVGYYSQEFETFDFEKTVIQTFMDDSKKDEMFARPFLGRYMFLGNKVFQKVATLSGGEKTRLSIACLTGHDYNLLILDEPTTYLDVTSQRVILEALKVYKGALIIVSHTQEFLQELEPERALLFPENKFVFWSQDLLDDVQRV